MKVLGVVFMEDNFFLLNSELDVGRKWKCLAHLEYKTLFLKIGTPPLNSTISPSADRGK